MGFEPTTFGTTIRHSNQLSYIHHLDSFLNRCANVIQIFVSAKHFVTFFSYKHRLYLNRAYIAHLLTTILNTKNTLLADFARSAPFFVSIFKIR